MACYPCKNSDYFDLSTHNESKMGVFNKIFVYLKKEKTTLPGKNK